MSVLVVPARGHPQPCLWVHPGSWDGMGSKSWISWISVLASVVSHGQEILELPCLGSCSTFWILAVTEEPLKSS